MANGQAIYIPKKSDGVDRAVGKFLNTYPEREKLKILFLRETEGVYRFGSKRVHVKVEKGNQAFVRVGGGFMHINDFVNCYTDEEIQKIYRNDVEYRYQSKLAV